MFTLNMPDCTGARAPVAKKAGKGYLNRDLLYLRMSAGADQKKI